VVVPEGSVGKVPWAQPLVDVELQSEHVHPLLLDFATLFAEAGLEARFLDLLPVWGEGDLAEPPDARPKMQSGQ